jgi:hypothetical protein
MTELSLLQDPSAGNTKAISGKRYSLPAREILAGIVKRSTGNHSMEIPDWLDPKRLVERAIEIDVEQPGSPLTEGQWDYGLDMLAREEAPAEAGLALRQERIIVALAKALAETKGEEKPLDP